MTLSDLKPAWSEWRSGMQSPIYAKDGRVVEVESAASTSPRLFASTPDGKHMATAWLVSLADYIELRNAAATINAGYVREPGSRDEACRR